MKSLYLKSITSLWCIMLSVVVAVGAVSCSDDDGPGVYDELQMSATDVQVEEGESATVTITSGSGTYSITTDDGNIADATLSGATVTITGKAVGATAVSVKDDLSGKSAQINVTVTAKPVAPISISYTAIGDWFGGEAPADADMAIARPADEEGISRTEYYAVVLDGGCQTELSAYTINGYNWKYTVNIPENYDNAAAFKAALAEYRSDASWKYANTRYSNEQDGGHAIAISEEELDAKLESGDFSKGNLYVGFRKGNAASIVQIVNGKASVVAQPTVFPDIWKWYAENFLNQSYDYMLDGYYFSIAHTGIIPPMFQLMIFDGIDKYGTAFNLALRAPMNGNFEQIEGAYTVDSPQEYWEKFMLDENAEEMFGKFEQAFAFPLPGDEIKIFNSIEETVEYVRANGLDSFDYLMPVFRINPQQAVVLQIESRNGLTVIVANLAAEGQTSAARLKSMKAAR